LNATLSDESKKEEKTLEEEKFLTFVAPHEDNEDSQFYYSENSEEEDMQLAYQLQYVEFLKLREKYKQQVLDLNSLRTDKTSMLIKINDLEESLLETQLQLSAQKSCSKASTAAEAYSSKKDLGPQEAVYGSTKDWRKENLL
jgi:hypothetical protein